MGHAALRADLGDTRLGDIDDRSVARWLRDLRARGQGGREDEHAASGAYKRLLRSALQACLTYAYVEGHLPERAALGTLRIEGSTKRALEQVDPLSLDEVSALLAASEPKYRAMWAVG